MLIRSLSAIFLSTPSGWRATTKEYRKIMGTLISIHALRVEGDTLGHQEAVFFAISIHALRVEGDSLLYAVRGEHAISIHALRVEGDNPTPRFRGDMSGDFYPRPPGGGRLVYDLDLLLYYGFLSTPSGWRATDVAIDDRHCARISIHALRVEGDGEGYRVALTDVAFLSTPSGWRATRRAADGAAGGRISIHALRVEGDGDDRRRRNADMDFYPRPPGGGRPVRVKLRRGGRKKFLSTPSGWRATSTLSR